jgi:hypothetical protein
MEEKMKPNKLTRMIAGIAIPVITAVTTSGCYSSGSGKLTLLQYEHDNRGALFVPKENIDTVSGHIYRQSPINNRNTITQETVNKAMDNNQNTVNKLVDNPIYQHYQNRK